MTPQLGHRAETDGRTGGGEDDDSALQAMLSAALSGELSGAEYRVDEVFGFEVPVAIPGVEATLLDPRSTWSDPARYDLKARELGAMFRDNFERFSAPELAASGPQL